MLCEEIYNRCRDKNYVRYYNCEMRPEEILEYMGKCRFVVTSRFHAMIFALMQRVPVLLVGWSHKYQEVLDYYNLGKYATDYSSLSTEPLLRVFQNVVNNEGLIRNAIESNYNKVLQSSYKNIIYVSEIIDSIKGKK